MKWISVEDRLPENNGNYIVSDRETVAEIYFEKRFEAWFGIDGDYQPILGITHWMPLPEPPKE